ncbi:MAG: glycosyltransferase family 9 protein [Pseudomonadota bacterium]
MKRIFRPLQVAILWIFDRVSASFLAWRQKSACVAQGSKSYEHGFVFTSDIGDAVLFSMFLLVFAHRVGGRCLVITSETNAGLLQPFFPEIDFLTLNYSRYKADPAYRFRKIREVMGIELGRCIVPMRSRDYCITDSIVSMARKTGILAFVSDESNRGWLEARLEKSIHSELLGGFSAGTHELQTYALLLDRFGVNFRKELERELPAFRKALREAAASLPTGVPADYVLMNIGASQQYKRWPIARFIALAERIHAESGMSSVFVGGPSERGLQGRFGAYPFIIDLVMRTGDFDVLRGVIINSRVVVSNDSFISHYSTVLGMPVVSIAGGGHFGRFLPYPEQDFAIFCNSLTISRKWPCFNCGWACTRLAGVVGDSFPCIGEIGVDEVFVAIGKAIEPGRCFKKGNP